MKCLKRDTTRILVISDYHAPFNHQDAPAFLQAVKAKYRPTLTILTGDEVDNHGISYHDKDPNIDSAGKELSAARNNLKPLYKLFPEADVLHSNHGNLLDRKALTHGIPQEMLKSNKEILQAPNGWNWHFDIMLKLPTGYYCYFHHSKGRNVLNNAQKMGCSFVQGHHHESFEVGYYSTPSGLHFGMTVGCLVDQKKAAFAFSKNNIKRFIVGVGVIIEGVPTLVPMLLDNNCRWIGVLP